ncbi:MAG: hypothetical protein HYT67_00260 [Candidatus Yanofskybacteria bacterium]|nr:hypothetical protein [Candidatus Yanofskybacteria bacterium]
MRGLRDIKTHGTLARKGRLVSVARDWHRINGGNGTSENQSWDGSIEPMVFKKNVKARRFSRPSQDLFRVPELEGQIRATLIKQVQESIVEMEMFSSEGVPGALAELQRLKAELSQLENR